MSQHWKAVTKEIVSRQTHKMNLHSRPFYRPWSEQDFSRGMADGHFGGLQVACRQPQVGNFSHLGFPSA
jgi:hypothetical protein